MIYEEDCRLKFGHANQDLMYAFDDHDDALSQTEEDYYHFQREQQIDSGSKPRSRSRPVAQESLGFGGGSLLLPDYFGPEPIEIRNGRKSKSKSRKGSRSKSKKTSAKKPKQQPKIASKNRPQTASTLKKPIGGGWNNCTTTESKFFDKGIDKEYQRRLERENNGPQRNKKNVTFDRQTQNQTTVQRDGINMDIKFKSRGGRQVNTLQVYKDIDSLNQLSGYHDDAGRKTYSISQNEEIIGQKQKKSPTKLNGPSGNLVPNSYGQIEIAGVCLEPADVAKLSSILTGQTGSSIQSACQIYAPEENQDQKLILQQSIADAKLQALMG